MNPMRIDELDISPEIIGSLKSQGFLELHPPQAEAIPMALTGRNLVVAIPTASGKSLIGYIPALKKIVQEGRKVLFIVPLKALAAEKKDDFDAFSHLGIRAHLSTGDLDNEDRGMERANVVVATSEKADSMVRHGSGWLKDLGLVIVDEVHTIHDPGRGPTLEVVLTKLMRRNRDMQVIALSATISNARDLAEWMRADLVRSDWRPIPLKEGIYMDDAISFSDGTERDVSGNDEPVWKMVKQTVEEGGQCLVFVNTRRSTEAQAVKLAKNMKNVAPNPLDGEDRYIIEGESEVTDLGRKLATCIEGGTAFHNAGLGYRQRRYVESNFRSGRIKCIVATPTLAAGVNLPARRVIIRDTTRFEMNSGHVPLPVMEIKQMCGRAGRPRFDPYGEAVLIADNPEEYDHLLQDYVLSESERITSKLFDDRTLRGHILGLLASGDADSDETIVEFLKETFFGTVSSMYGVESVVEKVVDFLQREEMVCREGDRIRVLPFGKRVSDLCIDPITASIARKAMLNTTDETPLIQILFAAAITPDVLGMFPKKADMEVLNAMVDEMEQDFLVDPYEYFESYYNETLFGDMKVALLMSKWIEETSEDTLFETMGLGPGDIHTRVDMMDWIVYSMREIALFFNPDAVPRMRNLSTRIRYGVREELVELVSFKGVGRSRARILFNNGIRTKEDVHCTPFEQLAAIPKIGQALARSMKGAVDRIMEPVPVMESHDIDEEAMLDEMAAEYGMAMPVEKPEEKKTKGASKKRVKKEKKVETGSKQASLFDF